MSQADKLFAAMCQEILDHGYSSQGQTVRAKWEDGTPAHTIKQFGIVNRYDLQEEFPALTLRPTAIKSAVDEMDCHCSGTRSGDHHCCLSCP